MTWRPCIVLNIHILSSERPCCAGVATLLTCICLCMETNRDSKQHRQLFLCVSKNRSNHNALQQTRCKAGQLAPRSSHPHTGNVTAIMLVLTFFAAMHCNGVLLLFLGLPFDRALPWHKLLALSTLANSAVHCAAWYGSDDVRRAAAAAPEASALAVQAPIAAEEEKYEQVMGLEFEFSMVVSGAFYLSCATVLKPCRGLLLLWSARSSSVKPWGLVTVVVCTVQLVALQHDPRHLLRS